MMGFNPMSLTNRLRYVLGKISESATVNCSNLCFLLLSSSEITAQYFLCFRYCALHQDKKILIILEGI